MMREYPVRYQLSQQFREKIQEVGLVVYKIIEQISQVLLLFIIDVPDDKQEYINDLAFMTHIRNPEFQKYYSLTDEVLEEIKKADEFQEFCQNENKRALEFEKIQKDLADMDDQVIVRLILDGCYPFYSRKVNRFIYLIDKDNHIIGTSLRDEFEEKWTRQLIYLGAGQLSDEQKRQIKKHHIAL
jgi:hypothetical protein